MRRANRCMHNMRASRSDTPIKENRAETKRREALSLTRPCGRVLMSAPMPLPGTAPTTLLATIVVVVAAPNPYQLGR